MLLSPALLLVGSLCAQQPPRLLHRTSRLSSLINQHLETGIKIAGRSGQIYSLSAQAWEVGGENGAMLVFYRSGAAPFGVSIGGNLFCVLCLEGGTLAEPEPGSPFRIRIAPRSQRTESVLTIQAEDGADPPVTISIFKLFQETGNRGRRFPIDTVAFGRMEGSLVYYLDLHDPARAPSIAVFFGEPLNVVKPVALSALPGCATPEGAPREPELWTGEFRKLKWRIGARRCREEIELYELGSFGGGGSPAAIESKAGPALEHLRRVSLDGFGR